MFDGLKIDWTLFNQIQNLFTERTVITIAENHPAFVDGPATPEELADIRYYTAMGEMLAKAELQSLAEAEAEAMRSIR